MRIILRQSTAEQAVKIFTLTQLSIQTLTPVIRGHIKAHNMRKYNEAVRTHNIVQAAMSAISQVDNQKLKRIANIAYYASLYKTIALGSKI